MVHIFMRNIQNEDLFESLTEQVSVHTTYTYKICAGVNKGPMGQPLKNLIQLLHLLESGKSGSGWGIFNFRCFTFFCGYICTSVRDWAQRFARACCHCVDTTRRRVVIFTTAPETESTSYGTHFILFISLVVIIEFKACCYIKAKTIFFH